MAINVSDAIRDALLDYSEEVVNATNGALRKSPKKPPLSLNLREALKTVRGSIAKDGR